MSVKKRFEAGDIVTKQELGKSFKWLVEQGIVVDEKEMKRARDEKRSLHCRQSRYRSKRSMG